MDRSFVQLNRASTERIRKLAEHLSDQELQHAMAAGWTITVALAHLAFWDRRVLHVLDLTEREGKLVKAEIDTLANDISLPLWAAIPPRAAALLAIQTATTLDGRLEAFPETLIEEIYLYNPRWVLRALHRNEHLDDVDQALKD